VIFALVGDADKPFLRRRQQEHTHWCIERAVGNVQDAITLGSQFEAAMELRQIVRAHLGAAKQFGDSWLVM
jgi:hypothetical protein